MIEESSHHPIEVTMLHGSIDSNAIRENALRQYKIEAIEAALDWDSIAAVMEEDCGRSFRPGR